MHVATQRRDPVRIIAMEAIGQIDKAIAVAPAAERGHLDSATSRRVPLACGASVGSIWRAGELGALFISIGAKMQRAWRCRPRADPMLFEIWTVSENRDSKKWLVLRAVLSPRIRRFRFGYTAR